jgi:hypothetical protein
LLELLPTGGKFAACDILCGSFEDVGCGSDTCFLDLEWAGCETGRTDVKSDIMELALLWWLIQGKCG